MLRGEDDVADLLVLPARRAAVVQFLHGNGLPVHVLVALRLRFALAMRHQFGQIRRRILGLRLGSKAESKANARMRPMAKSLGSFRAALLIGWVALAAAGVLFARFKDIPGWAAGPVLAAFLVEYPFYLVPAFPDIRKRLSGMALPLFLLASLLLPYLVCYRALPASFSGST